LLASLDEQLILSASEIEQGWRLACRGIAEADITLDIAQWETVILSDDSTFEFTPREGLGVAIDLGTTTLVAQLLDLVNGRVLGVRTALNPQAAWGADVMSRIQFALRLSLMRASVSMNRSTSSGFVKNPATPYFSASRMFSEVNSSSVRETASSMSPIAVSWEMFDCVIAWKTPLISCCT
jgi:hypothetical protein